MAKRNQGSEQPSDTASRQNGPTQDQNEGQHETSGGRGWHGDPEGHAAAGRKGGQKVARNREHMAAIGRKGGVAVSKDRQHMANIGRKGGQARGDAPPEASGQ